MDRKLLFSVSIVVVVQLMGVNAYKTHIIAPDYCDIHNPKVLRLGQISDSGIILKLPNQKYQYEDCKVFIKPVDLDHGIVAYVKNAQMKRDYRGCSDYLKMTYDVGRKTPEICESSELTYVTKPPIDSISLEFVLKNVLENRSFEIVFTQYRENCKSDDFQCEKEDRCIWKGLTCDGYNGCGDNSDEDCFPLVYAIVGGVVGGVVLIAIVVAVVFFLRRRNSRPNTHKTTKYANP